MAAPVAPATARPHGGTGTSLEEPTMIDQLPVPPRVYSKWVMVDVEALSANGVRAVVTTMIDESNPTSRVKTGRAYQETRMAPTTMPCPSSITVPNQTSLQPSDSRGLNVLQLREHLSSIGLGIKATRNRVACPFTTVLSSRAKLMDKH